MLFRFLADLVLVTHASFILLVVFGWMLVTKYPKLAWIHIPVVIYAAMNSLFRWVCPLTPLENYFRILAGEQGYDGGFIAHYLLPIIYPGELTTTITISIGLFVLIWNSLFYTILIYRNKRR